MQNTAEEWLDENTGFPDQLWPNTTWWPDTTNRTKYASCGEGHAAKQEPLYYTNSVYAEDQGKQSKAEPPEVAAIRNSRRHLIRDMIGASHPWALEAYSWGEGVAHRDYMDHCVPAVLQIIRSAPWRVPHPRQLAEDICETSWARRFNRRTRYVRAMRTMHRRDLPAWQVEYKRALAALSRQRHRLTIMAGGTGTMSPTAHEAAGPPAWMWWQFGLYFDPARRQRLREPTPEQMPDGTTPPARPPDDPPEQRPRQAEYPSDHHIAHTRSPGPSGANSAAELPGVVAPPRVADPRRGSGPWTGSSGTPSTQMAPFSDMSREVGPLGRDGSEGNPCGSRAPAPVLPLNPLDGGPCGSDAIRWGESGGLVTGAGAHMCYAKATSAASAALSTSATHPAPPPEQPAPDKGHGNGPGEFAAAAGDPEEQPTNQHTALRAELSVIADKWAEEAVIWDEVLAKMDWLYWCFPFAFEQLRASSTESIQAIQRKAMEECENVWAIKSPTRVAFGTRLRELSVTDLERWKAIQRLAAVTIKQARQRLHQGRPHGWPDREERILVLQGMAENRINMMAVGAPIEDVTFPHAMVMADPDAERQAILNAMAAGDQPEPQAEDQPEPHIEDSIGFYQSFCTKHRAEVTNGAAPGKLANTASVSKTPGLAGATNPPLFGALSSKPSDSNKAPTLAGWQGGCQSKSGEQNATAQGRPHKVSRHRYTASFQVSFAAEIAAAPLRQCDFTPLRASLARQLARSQPVKSCIRTSLEGGREHEASLTSRRESQLDPPPLSRRVRLPSPPHRASWLSRPPAFPGVMERR